MKRLLTILVLFSTLISFNKANGQDTGVVRFQVDVDNGYFEIVVNDTLFLERYKDTLPVGNYTAKIWSPGYVLTEASFEIKKDQSTDVYVPMAISNERIDYERDYKDYRLNFHKHLTFPVSLTLLTGLTTAYFMMKAYDHRKTILADVEHYRQSSSTLEIAEIKSRIDDTNGKYNRNRIGYYISGGLTSIFLVGTIYSYTYFKRNFKEPTLTNESPFKDRFSLFPTPYGCAITIGIG